MYPKVKTLISWILVLIVTSGCDDRATQIAREAADRQAKQNTEMTQLNKEVARGTHRLVEADAQARKEIIGVHHELQSERSRLDTGRDALEQDRRQLATQRHTESMFASLAPLIGGMLLLIVLLGFCWYALAAANHSEDTELKDLLVREIVRDGPSLLTASEDNKNLLGHSLPDDQPVR